MPVKCRQNRRGVNSALELLSRELGTHGHRFQYSSRLVQKKKNPRRRIGAIYFLKTGDILSWCRFRASGESVKLQDVRVRLDNCTPHIGEIQADDELTKGLQ